MASRIDRASARSSVGSVWFLVSEASARCISSARSKRSAGSNDERRVHDFRTAAAARRAAASRNGGTWLARMRLICVVGVAAAEEALAHERLPQHDTDGVQVRLRRRRRPLDQLRRQIAELALDGAGRRHGRAIGGARQPEVGELDDALHAEEHVLRADVAMDDRRRLAFGVDALVRRAEAAQDLDADGGDLVPRRRRAAERLDPGARDRCRRSTPSR